MFYALKFSSFHLCNAPEAVYFCTKNLHYNPVIFTDACKCTENTASTRIPGPVDKKDLQNINFFLNLITDKRKEKDAGERFFS